MSIKLSNILTIREYYTLTEVLSMMKAYKSNINSESPNFPPVKALVLV